MESCSIKMVHLSSEKSKRIDRERRKPAVFLPQAFYCHEPIFLSTDLLDQSPLIKPNRLIDSARVFINASVHIEDILPALLRQPRCNLCTPAAMMAHDIDRRLLILRGIG